MYPLCAEQCYDTLFVPFELGSLPCTPIGAGAFVTQTYEEHRP